MIRASSLESPAIRVLKKAFVSTGLSRVFWVITDLITGIYRGFGDPARVEAVLGRRAVPPECGKKHCANILNIDSAYLYNYSLFSYQ